ncbi:MAG: hypothetical protein A2Z74_05965 [Chloroflexi bacterium RBG_13_46_9]|nr:MAG: hypothetical protein A2Z74_05965 [Chloroflexi bacterium RBG_13_46_9]
MTIDDLTQIITEVQKLQSELDDVEVKAARKGTPQRLFEALSALSNRPGGGVLLLGLDESKRFESVGVGNAHRLQEEISHLAASEMEPPLRPKFTVKDSERKTVVAVEISEIPATRELRNLTDYGLVDLHGSRRWAYYTLNVPVEAPPVQVALETDEEKILAYVREHGSIKRAECQALLNVTETQARYILKKMKDRLLLRLEGTGKPSRYLLPDNTTMIQT